MSNVITSPVRAHAHPSRVEGTQKQTIENESLLKVVYVSGDEYRRGNGLLKNFAVVCQHPNEVCNLGVDEKLIIDFDYVLFGDYHEAVALAVKAARDGRKVGIHTFHPHHHLLEPLTKFPNVTIAKTLDEL